MQGFDVVARRVPSRLDIISSSCCRRDVCAASIKVASGAMSYADLAMCVFYHSASVRVCQETYSCHVITLLTDFGTQDALSE